MNAIIYLTVISILGKSAHAILCLSSVPPQWSWNASDAHFNPDRWLDQISLEMKETVNSNTSCPFTITFNYRQHRLNVSLAPQTTALNEEHITTTINFPKTGVVPICAIVDEY